MPLLDDMHQRLIDFRATLHPLQLGYAAAHAGRFFQGLPTHSAEPADGNEEIPDRLNTRPAYQAETWRDLFGGAAPLALPILIECHQYQMHSGGRGYFVVARIRVNGNIWRRSVGQGPQSALFTEPWEKIT